MGHVFFINHISKCSGPPPPPPILFDQSQINAWFASYLLGRSQVTKVGFNSSTEYIISCGVPQGSVLGPLLFLIYINDIHNSSAKLSFYLFADDTSLLYADTNLKSLEKKPPIANCSKSPTGSMQIRFRAKLWNPNS